MVNITCKNLWLFENLPSAKIFECHPKTLIMRAKRAYDVTTEMDLGWKLAKAENQAEILYPLCTHPFCSVLCLIHSYSILHESRGYSLKILTQECSLMNSQQDQSMSNIVTGNIIQMILAEQNKDQVHSVYIWAPLLSAPSLFFYTKIQRGLCKNPQTSKIQLKRSHYQLRT